MRTQETDPGRVYNKILVAVDYHKSIPEVFEQALDLAKSQGGELKIFYCLAKTAPASSLIYSGAGGYGGIYTPEIIDLEQKIIQESQDALESWLSGLVQEAKARAVKADCLYQIGQPGLEICQVARDWGADLIVLGRRGRKGLSEVILGSVSNYVLHHATCSVLVIQH